MAPGAYFCKPDLGVSSDGVRMARHVPWLSDSTEIAARPEFAGRKRTLTGPEGETLTDWWAFDFTAAELKTLRAKQVRDGRSKSYDGLYEIPTFDEIIALATREGDARGRVVGLYPETKWPAEHTPAGLAMAGALGAAPTAPGLEGWDAPVFTQSVQPASP